MRHECAPWSVKSEEHKCVSNIPLDRPTYKDDVQHQSSIHILKQKHKFDTWLASKDSLVEANCLLILYNRLIMMLGKQLENQMETFKEKGGFSEALSAERLARRAEQSAQNDAPLCPKCGKPMIKRMAKKGKNAGNAFWSCSSYPNCDGTRNAWILLFCDVERNYGITLLRYNDIVDIESSCCLWTTFSVFPTPFSPLLRQTLYTIPFCCHWYRDKAPSVFSNRLSQCLLFFHVCHVKNGKMRRPLRRFLLFFTKTLDEWQKKNYFCSRKNVVCHIKSPLYDYSSRQIPSTVDCCKRQWHGQDCYWHPPFRQVISADDTISPAPCEPRSAREPYHRIIFGQP